LLAGGLAVCGPSVFTLNLFAYATLIPLGFFYLMSPSTSWDMLQIWSAVTAIFVPLSVVLGLQFNIFELTTGLVFAQVILTSLSLAVAGLLWLRVQVESNPIRVVSEVNHIAVIGVAFVAIVVSNVIRVPVVGDRMLFAAAVYAAAATAGDRGLIRGFRWSYFALSSFLFLLYLTTVFTGFGRLLMAALGLGLVLGWTGMRSTFLFRAGAVAAMVPLLLLASFIETTRSDSNGSVSIGAADFSDGLGSVFGPISTFAAAIDRDLANDRDIIILPERSITRGSTILAAFVSPVPRVLWPSKPEGIGRSGFVEFYPELKNFVSSIHTLAFMMVGEFYFEFGLVGAGIGCIFWTWFLLRVHRKVTEATSGGRVLTREQLAVYILFLAGLPDLVWGGLFGLAGRPLIRILLLLAVVGSINFVLRIAQGPVPHDKPKELVRNG